ncbi:hypothetical protein OFY05_23190 (plasmid) [Pseudocitrobacter faecalis]|nr:hypothetical protein OFY05_23190 [Pseudocitrobacter faecalis]
MFCPLRGIADAEIIIINGGATTPTMLAKEICLLRSGAARCWWALPNDSGALLAFLLLSVSSRWSACRS